MAVRVQVPLRVLYEKTITLQKNLYAIVSLFYSQDKKSLIIIEIYKYFFILFKLPAMKKIYFIHYICLVKF